MKTTTILFDLDGTLLPMEQEAFVQAYFGPLAAKMAPLGYAPEELIGAIWSGTAAMVQNDGSATNEAVFWREFCRIFGADARKDEPVLDEFYRTDFIAAKSACGFQEKAAQTLAKCRALGFRTALATNPIFPAVATHRRIRWAGLTPEEFELVTTYENSRFCKPNLDYYRDVTAALGVTPEECLMVGNDVAEDMIAGELGMKTFLLTDCLINKPGRAVDDFRHGGFDELLDYLEEVARNEE